MNLCSGSHLCQPMHGEIMADCESYDNIVMQREGKRALFPDKIKITAINDKACMPKHKLNKAGGGYVKRNTKVEKARLLIERAFFLCGR
jgi:hypothetical protein